MAAAAIVLAAPAVGQTVTVPPDLANVEGSSTGNIWRGSANRVQCIYSASTFIQQGLGHPISIHSLSFRLAGGAMTNLVNYPSVNIYLQRSATSYQLPSTTFAANRTFAFPTTPNFSGALSTTAVGGTTPNGQFLAVTLSTPFAYVASDGADLLVEIEILTPPTPLLGNATSTTASSASGCNTVRSVGSTTALTGTVSGLCPVIQFGYVDTPGGARSEIYGAGCYLRQRSFYEVFAGGACDLGGKTVAMTQNARGGYDVATTAGATVVAPSGASLGLGDDAVSAAITLPFTFDYPGGSTTQVYVDSNGSILLNGPANSTFGGSSAALMGSSVHRLCPSLQDLDPSVAGGVFAQARAGGPLAEFLITWQAVPCFGANTPSTFQVALIDNGTSDRCEFRYQSLSNDSVTNGGTAVTGFSLGLGQFNPGNRDLTAGAFATTADQLPLFLGVARRPIVGNPLGIDLVTSGIPAAPGISFILLSTGQLQGVDLGILGMGGCQAYVTLPEFQSIPSLGAPSVNANLLVPSDPLLVGAAVFAQAAALAPGSNAFGALSSNGVGLTIGNL